MDWWLIAVIVLVAMTFGMRVLRARRTSAGASQGRASVPPADFARDRETARVSGLSNEERDWEAAALQRSREADAPAPDPADRRA